MSDQTFQLTIDHWKILREVFEVQADELDSVPIEDVRHVAATLDHIVKALENGDNVEVLNIPF